MKFLVLLFACLGLHVSSVSGLSTYVNTSRLTLNIMTTYGTPHWYSGINIAPGAYLDEVDLLDADLAEVDLYNSILTNAILTNANLTGAIFAFATLTDANLADADLTGAILFDADLTGANLTNTDLTGANLSNADLTGADLTNADLIGTNLSSVILLGGNWTGANLYGASLPDGYDQAWFQEAGAIFVETVPEPSTYALLLSGAVLGYAFWRRRK
jgi:uncharacterized protein YjbI with pentapeptide repeats